MCKLPYGESDFKKIRQNNFVYIDTRSAHERDKVYNTTRE